MLMIVLILHHGTTTATADVAGAHDQAGVCAQTNLIRRDQKSEHVSVLSKKQWKRYMLGSLMPELKAVSSYAGTGDPGELSPPWFRSAGCHRFCSGTPPPPNLLDQGCQPCYWVPHCSSCAGVLSC